MEHSQKRPKNIHINLFQCQFHKNIDESYRFQSYSQETQTKKDVNRPREFLVNS
jgi:hypothetical protein